METTALALVSINFFGIKKSTTQLNPSVGDFPHDLTSRESAMNSRIVLRLATVAALAAGGAIVSAQGATPALHPEARFRRQRHASLRRLVR